MHTFLKNPSLAAVLGFSVAIIKLGRVLEVVLFNKKEQWQKQTKAIETWKSSAMKVSGKIL